LATDVIEGKFLASTSTGEVSSILLRPEAASYLYVFGHGAGAGMRHPSMEATAQALAEQGIATFRYNFPYMENGRGAPDPKPVIYATVRAAVHAAGDAAADLPLIAGGRSFGGRMTSTAESQEHLGSVKGLVFYAFPLHPAGKPSVERAEHLQKVQIPMLFLQGTRDALAELSLLEPVCESLGEKATLHVVDTADHSFHVQKSSGKTDAGVLMELAQSVRAWADKL
jgi:uncharacterized protein